MRRGRSYSSCWCWRAGEKGEKLRGEGEREGEGGWGSQIKTKAGMMGTEAGLGDSTLQTTRGLCALPATHIHTKFRWGATALKTRTPSQEGLSCPWTWVGFPAPEPSGLSLCPTSWASAASHCRSPVSPHAGLGMRTQLYVGNYFPPHI